MLLSVVLLMVLGLAGGLVLVVMVVMRPEEGARGKVMPAIQAINTTLCFLAMSPVSILPFSQRPSTSSCGNVGVGWEGVTSLSRVAHLPLAR